ncbi:MAG: ribonuclease D [Pseudomonadota bacterium]
MKIITSTKALAEVCEAYAKSDFVTVDTEFLRESTFWPILCLIQMAVEDDEVIVDVMAPGLDLQPFFDLMADESTVKVFHAARQDVEIVHHLGGIIPQPLFDTQIAAMVCGFGDSIAYDQLANRVNGARIDKSSRFTDWSNRPLSQKQLKYALADVTHLRDVYRHLTGLLEEKKREHWVSEEMKVLTSTETYDVSPADAWKRLKLRVRKSRDFELMKRLAAWREERAQERDQPRRRVLKDDAIYEIAQQHPKDAKALARLRSLPNGFERSRFAGELVNIVHEVARLDPDDLPKVPRPPQAPEGTGAATEMLKVLLKLVGEQHGVATKVIATVDELEKIAANDDADVPALHGWRRELFGQAALQLKNGELGLGFKDRKISLVELAE